MSETCELCGDADLDPVYEPDGSRRGLTVHVCLHCGLVQSLPRIDRERPMEASVSGAADWGNVRYGKAFRTETVLAALKRRANFLEGLALLDVGSNRGSFTHAFLAAASQSHVVAVEPDSRVAPSCAGLERTALICGRIEDVALESGRFDIVHSCHTIEHLAHPVRVLRDHHRTLKPGGLLVLDAPNIAALALDDIVEEWFIDKHLYHFSLRTLTRLVEQVGFELIDAPVDVGDRENILIVARKSGVPRGNRESDPLEVSAAQQLIARYGASRTRNLAALSNVAADIARFAPRRVAIWGAGRLFDTLVTRGGLAPHMLSLLVDTHLRAHVGERFGVRLAGPDELRQVKPDVVVIMSRRFAGEIAHEAKRLVPGAEIVTYADLIARAQFGKAA